VKDNVKKGMCVEQNFGVEMHWNIYWCDKNI